MDLNDLTIAKINKGLLEKEFSCQEICQSYLERIEERNRDIFAFLSVDEDGALSQAKKVDELISNGKDISLLSGIPLSVKDSILVEGMMCTAGSKILKNYKAPYDATAVKKLKKQEAIILGKTNCDEFTMGSSTENSAFGVTKNPCDLERVPGGSSGGSAAAVADNMCVCALGSDTGGSIRQPSSFCGIIGLKPTYGAVSRYGLMAHASSLDQIGPMAKTVEDCRILFDAIKGKDEMDSTSVESKFFCMMREKFKVHGLKLGIPKEYFVKGMDAGVEKVVGEAIEYYQKMGAEIKEITLPHAEYALPVYYIIVTSEASSNLARYDGIRFGKSEIKDDRGILNLMDYYLRVRGDGFGEEVKRRIMLGTYSLSSGYYDAYYLRAQKVRTLIRLDFERAFEEVDFILTPVSPTTAFKIGEKVEDPVSMYLSDIFTVSINLAGLPALSLPCGNVNGLPVGLQIIGRPFGEENIFNLAQKFNKKTTE